MKRTIIVIISLIILIGIASYFYSLEQNRNLIQKVYRELLELEVFVDYRERHFYMYTNSYFFNCQDKNITECRRFLSTYGWKLYREHGTIVRFNVTWIDGLVNSFVDTYHQLFYGLKLLVADFGHYTRIYMYKAEVLSKRGLDPIYFPEPYQMKDKLFQLKLDEDMRQVFETPLVIVAIYYNAITSVLKGWISGVWLLFYVILDETIMQFIVASFLLNFLVVVTKEFIFFGVSTISGGTIKYWMFQKYTSFLQEIGLLDVFNNAMGVLFVIRIIFILIGLPHLFNVGIVYGLLMVLAYCFWYVINHIQHKVKYEVELKIKADVGLKKATKVELSYYTFMERFGIWFLQSFWNVVPLTLRLYRQGFDFRPFKDLVAPTKYHYYGALVCLPILLPIIFVVDIVFHSLAWTFCYLWLYPYVFNRRISEVKWMEIMKAIGDKSVVINSEELLEKEDYLYNLVRSILLIIGFYNQGGEMIRIKSKFSEFIGDIRDSNPANNMHYWAKVYGMPIRYLKGKFLVHKPTAKEKYNLFIEGLEQDAYRLYGTRDIRLIWTTGSKDNNKLNLVKSIIDSVFLKKFGKRWQPEREQPIYQENAADIVPPPGIETRYKGNYKHVLLDFEPQDFEYGFRQFVRQRFDGNKLMGMAGNLVLDGDIADISDMELNDGMFLLCAIRYTALLMYEEDVVTIDALKGIDDKYYIQGVLDTDYCKTVCLSACVMANMNIVLSIKQSLVTDIVVKTKYPEVNYFIKDAYERLALNYKIQPQVEVEFKEKESLVDYRQVYLPEYLDFTETGHSDIALKYQQLTGVKGSILTQLGHLKSQQVNNEELQKLYKIYAKQIYDLKNFQIYPVYATGLVHSDVAISDELIVLLMKSMALKTEINNEFLLWLSKFNQNEFPHVLAWFIQHNKTFLYRLIDRSILDAFYVRAGLDVHKIWFQPDSQFELSKNQFYNYLDKIRHVTDPIFIGGGEDDEYIELEDMVSEFAGLDYGNMSKLAYTQYNKDIYPGLKTIGVQKDYTMDEIQMVVNTTMVNHVRNFAPSINMAEYIIANPNKDLVFNALDKYKRRRFVHPENSYQGINFTEWLFEQLDTFYKIGKGFKAVVRDIESFSIDDLSLQSRKASPGFVTGRNKVRNKADKLEFTKAWAKDYRKSILLGDPYEHIWMTIVVPKTCKPGQEEVRVINAPEMYFYINQYLIFNTFVQLSKKSLVTDDFCLFFGKFDTAVRKHTVGYEIESLDLRHQGGRIQREIKDLFVEWYGRLMPTQADKLMLSYIMNDIFKCKFMIPANYGGFIFQKEDGWCDGPYGTNQFDSWAMVVYYLMNVWDNAIQFNLDITDFKTNLVNIESHGDNWIHSYPVRLTKLLSWRPLYLANIGQEVKGSISRSQTPIGLELMGFVIKMENGLYVGTRPTGKVVKSLIFNHRKYKDKDTQRSYEKSIISCLRLVDCWNQEAFTLLNRLDAVYASVPNKPITVDDEYKLYILENVDMQPRRAWTHESEPIFTVTEADPTSIDRWIDLR